MRTTEDHAHAHAAWAAFGDTRPGTPGDAILGVVPTVVVRPASAEDVARALGHATAARQSIVLQGAGTKRDWGKRPGAVDILLDLGRLNRVVAHQHGDLIATFEGGASLVAANRELMQRGQWLPLDTAFEAATVGGLIATNDSGPLRHRHGAPRDLVIGVTLATADGRLVKAGGQVVKNVAGYDLGKLVSGSFGAFAAVVSATFKLAPYPRASKTLVAEFNDDVAVQRAINAMGASQVEPLAFEVEARYAASSGCGARRLLVRIASAPEAVDAGVGDAAPLMLGGAASVVEGDDGVWWTTRAGQMWESAGTVARLSWRPATFELVSQKLAGIAKTNGLDIDVVGRAALGAGLVRIEGDAGSQVEAIAQLRSKSSPIGQLTVLRADEAVRGGLDVWALPVDLAAPLRAIKSAFDPAGVLGAGRGPV